MAEETTYLTAEGLEQLKAELDRLIHQERPAVAQRIAEAKALGDISDNADYETAKAEQAFLEGRIATLEAQLHNVEIISGSNGKIIGVGSRVWLREASGDKYDFTIVGAFEAKPSAGRISNVSPLGKALLGHRSGETVSVNTPDGVVDYKITKVA